MTSRRPSDSSRSESSRPESRPLYPRSRPTSEREREPREYSRSNSSRDLPPRQCDAQSDLQRRNSRSSPPRDRRSRSPQKSSRPRTPARQRSRSPPIAPTSHRPDSSTTKEKATDANVGIAIQDAVVPQLAEQNKKFMDVFMRYATISSSFSSLELRRDEAKRLKELRCSEFDKSSHLHTTFPMTFESQSRERQSAIEYLDKLDKEYKDLELELQQAIGDMVACINPVNLGVDPAVQELKSRCGFLESELRKTAKELDDARSDIDSFKHQVNHKIDAQEVRSKESEEVGNLSHKITTIVAQVMKLEETARITDKDTKAAKAETDTVKKELQSVAQRLQFLENKLSVGGGSEGIDLHGMRKNLETTAKQVDDLSIQLRREGGFEARLGHLEADYTKAADNILDASNQRLHRLEAQFSSVADVDSRVSSLQTDVARHEDTFAMVTKNTAEADDDYQALEERVMKLEQRESQRTVLTPQTNPSPIVDETPALQKQFHAYDAKLQNSITNEHPLIAKRITEICKMNPGTQLHMLFNHLKAKTSELLQFVNEWTNRPEQTYLRHISICFEGLNTSADLLLLRMEQEERDLAVSPYLEKIDLIDEHAQKLKALQDDISKLQEGQQVIRDQELVNLSKRIEEVKTTNSDNMQHSHPRPAQPQSNTGHNAASQHSMTQSNWSHVPQYTNQPTWSPTEAPNGVTNGVVNPAIHYTGPPLENIVAELRNDVTHLKEATAAAVVGINNLDSRMNNLSTGHVVKFLVDHLHNMYPEVRNASNEMAKLSSDLNRVERIANKNHDTSMRVLSLEKSQGEYQEKLTFNLEKLQAQHVSLEENVTTFKTHCTEQIDDKLGHSHLDEIKKFRNDTIATLTTMANIPNTIQDLKTLQDEIQQKVRDLDKKFEKQIEHFDSQIEEMSTDFVQVREDVRELQEGSSMALNNTTEQTSASTTLVTPVASSRPKPARAATDPSINKRSAATSNGDVASRKRKKQSMLWRDSSAEGSDG